MNNSFLILFVLIFSCKSIPVDKDNTSKSEINTKIDHFEILEPTDLKENQLNWLKNSETDFWVCVMILNSKNFQVLKLQQKS